MVAPGLVEIFDDATGFLFDTKALFERWLQLVGRATAPDASVVDCEVTFEVELHVDGLCRTNIRSAYGTLVITDEGRVEADIDVRVALINGYFDGTLRASEQVVIENKARVFGSIHTPSLSIRAGAVFHGNSVALTTSPAESLPENFRPNLDLPEATQAGA